MFSTNLPPAANGTYGKYYNVVCGYFKIGTICIFTFKGNVQGVVDFPYNLFGANYVLPAPIPNGIKVTTSTGTNGGTLTIKAGPNSVQLSASQEDIFIATFALFS